MPAKTSYAKNGEVSLAYQVVGDGPRDLLLTTGWVLPMESFWEDAAYVSFIERLATFSRVILWDKRGTGVSDRVTPAELPTLEERMEDMTAVLDAAAAPRAALVGLSEGAMMSAVFAAIHPERVTDLVLYGGWAATTSDDDCPGLMEAEAGQDFIEGVGIAWGEVGGLLQLWAPSVAEDTRMRDWWNRSLMSGASPGAAVAWLRMTARMDVRRALPSISVPTLVLHRRDDRIVPAENGTYLAEHIAQAKHVELPGEDHLWWVGDADSLLDEIEEFLTGSRGGRDHDRALMTLLFTDVVESTARAAELGDRRWRDLSAAHDRLVREQLARFRGREVKALGDGFLATFDGPARAIRCACAIRDRSRELDLPVRAGLHTGECELTDGDVRGIAVHIAARVGALAQSGEVLVSSTVRDLVVGSGIEFDDRGAHRLKGVPEDRRLFAVTRT
ncbi:MAG: alpha/beta fold hydrolase [Solirubrobacteraceae bacterium]